MSPSDRRPLRFEDRYLWHNHDHYFTSIDHRPDYLPGDVFERLTGYIPRDNPRVSAMVKAYATREAAMAAYVRAVEQPVVPKTDLQNFQDMLERAGIAHGLRVDFNPPGTAVQVELGDDGRHHADFWFDEGGMLSKAYHYTD